MTTRPEPWRILPWAFVAIFVAAALAGALGGWTGWDWHGGGMMAVGPLLMVLPVLLVVLLVVALTDRGRSDGAPEGTDHPAGGPGALAVAKRRYAAGEIGRDEFLRIRDDVEGGRTR